MTRRLFSIVTAVILSFLALPPSVTAESNGFVSLYFSVAQPEKNNLSVGSEPIPGSSFRTGLGGGLKVGTYFGHLRSIPGIELDISGLTADATTTSGFRSSKTTLTLVNSMVNLLVRYPGNIFQPYIGIGGGLSIAMTGGEINSRTMRLTGGGRTGSFAYQLLAGLRSNVTESLFLFLEYKYFDASYDWGIENSAMEVSLAFQAHIFNTGIGLRF